MRRLIEHSICVDNSGIVLVFNFLSNDLNDDDDMGGKLFCNDNGPMTILSCMPGWSAARRSKSFQSKWNFLWLLAIINAECDESNPGQILAVGDVWPKLLSIFSLLRLFVIHYCVVRRTVKQWKSLPKWTMIILITKLIGNIPGFNYWSPRNFPCDSLFCKWKIFFFILHHKMSVLERILLNLN